VLHHFANHELLALELMALALLKFPDAPESFRRGIVRTMVEEQSHMGQYISRMNEFGYHVGDFPLSGFFWQALSNMASPLEYVATMSMTFEQANLDYALYYQNIFRQIGDEATTTVLEKVYLDEIQHVKYGYDWFRHWKSQDGDDFDTFEGLLPWPLTPARAKGVGFDEVGRRQVGFSQDFISRLRVFSYSKGRPPQVWYFNPFCEWEVAADIGGYPWDPPKNHLLEDLGTILHVLAKPDDVVVVKKKPSLTFLEDLDRSGFCLPQFITHMGELKERQIQGFSPWGWSPRSEAYAWQVSEVLANKQVVQENLKTSENDRKNFQICFAKSWGQEQLSEWYKINLKGPLLEKKLSTCGRSLCSQDEVMVYQKELLELGYEQIVLKGIFAASGRDQIRARTAQGFSDQQISWFLRQLGLQNKVLGEPWLDRILDLTVLASVDRGGTVKVLGVLRAINTKRGQFWGHVFGHPLQGQSQNMKAWFKNSKDGRDQFTELQQCVKWVGKALGEHRFSGAFGVDCFIYRDHKTGEYELKPICEVNPRHTMGMVAWELNKMLAPQSVGFWFLKNIASPKKTNEQNIEEWLENLRQLLPAKIVHGKWQQGVFVLTDWSSAQSYVAVAILARDLEQLEILAVNEGFPQSITTSVAASLRL
jgi:uncharacterized ferritin-like protein (DUF455 family)